MKRLTRKRSGFAATEDQVAALPRGELGAQIASAEFRATRLRLSASLRRSAMQQLVWLESIRERLHGVPAPQRERL